MHLIMHVQYHVHQINDYKMQHTFFSNSYTKATCTNLHCFHCFQRSSAAAVMAGCLFSVAYGKVNRMTSEIVSTLWLITCTSLIYSAHVL